MTPDLPVTDVPSARTLVRATIAAGLLAALLLVTVILPVEYGIDPLHTGRALGLLRAPVDSGSEAPPSAASGALTPRISGPLTQFDASYRTDQATFALGPYDYIEYKYSLVQGAAMTYTWEASAPVLHDFHGAPDGSPATETSYAKETRQRDAGSLTAPFTGLHGWYWENPGGTPITVRLATSGFYATATEFRSNRSRRPHELASPLQPSPSTAP